jgi:uncharacterized membrane protein YdjX (TVP38/TMEM64 family)
MHPAEESTTVPMHHHRYRLGRWLRLTRRVAAGALLLAGIAVVVVGPGPSAVWAAVRENLDAWQGWVGRNPLPAAFGFFLAVTAATSLPLPVLTLTSLLAGALFGTVFGALLTSLAYTGGVTISFLIARWLFRERLRRAAGAWLRRFERGVERDGAYYLFTLRLMPSVPFFLINVLMALTPIPTRTYSVVSWLGSLPLAFVCAGVGTGLAALESPSDALSPPVLGALVALALFPLLARKLLRLVRPHAQVPTPDRR